MAMRRKLVKGGAIALVVALLGAWAAGEALINRTNPPGAYAGMILSPEADPVLRRACFDCHSHETRYPAYTYLPVASLLVARHVSEGREELNFSLWDRLTAEGRAEALEETVEQVQRGEMPTWDYTLIQPAARLSAADVAMIEQAARQAPGARAPGGAKRESDGKERSERRERGERR